VESVAEGIVLKDLLAEMVSRGASDLHLKPGNCPVLRIDGVLTRMEGLGVLRPAYTQKLAMDILPARQLKDMMKKMEAECGYGVSGVGRFRVSVYQQRGVYSMVFRHIPTEVPSMEELNLPPVLKDLALERRGLILVTGTTASGKSTTLAAMIELINQHRNVNVITIEDPIEFLFKDKMSIISQREVGTDVLDFHTALRSSLRQDPDVIMVGEMRDLETMETALSAAETGHLVLSTLHTLDAPETVNRIISVFPSHYQQQIRIQLFSTFKAIISMRLVRRKGGGRVPAVEILVSTPAVREAILIPEKFKTLRSLIEEGYSQYGMQTFDQSLFDLYQKDLITIEEALAKCSNPDEFKLRMRGIVTAAEMSKLELEEKKETYKEKQKQHMEIERF
jgi:twitching motility protein PilT